MGASNHPGLALPKPTPGVLARGWKRAEAATKLEKCYAKVDARDDSTCWVTGLKVTPFAQDHARRREHHHLAGRRVKPEWKFDVNRIITLSRYVHELVTKHILLVIGDDARRPIVFAWNPRMVKANAAPFHIRPSVAATPAQLRAYLQKEAA